MSAMIDEAELKKLLKAAVVEAITENRGLVRDIVEEALEEIALARAIDEGLESKPVMRDEIFHILESAQ